MSFARVGRVGEDPREEVGVGVVECKRYGITQCYLPTSRGGIPAFTQPIKAGTRFIDPEKMKG